MADAGGTIPRNPRTEYERRDVPLFAYAIAAIGLTALIGLAPLVIRGAYPTVGHDVDRHATIEPRAPRLQTSPRGDLEKYLAEQNALLHSYGWVDRDKEIAREPIEEAMKRLAHDGIDGFPKEAPPQ